MSYEQRAGVAESDWRHGFQLLAALERGRWPDWSGPAEFNELRVRVATLAVLLDLVPRYALTQLPSIVTAWCKAFPKPGRVERADLKAIVRIVLSVPGDVVRASRTGAAHVRQVLGIPPAEDGTSTTISIAPDVAAENACVRAIQAWHELLEHHPRWTHLPAMVPGEAARPIDDVYVELFAMPPDDCYHDRSSAGTSARRSRRFLATEHPVVDVPTLVARTLERGLILGEPGSGKSTVLHWIARAVHAWKCPDFSLGLFVSLGAYALALVEHPGLSLVEFFLTTLGTTSEYVHGAAQVLKAAAVRQHDFLLLLDGWDEIPSAQRALVARSIEAESGSFTVLMTSRPSGFPQGVWGGERCDTYQVAGLSPRAKRELIENLVPVGASSDLAGAVLKRIDGDADLQEMSTNPFLLGLLVKVLSRDLKDERLRTIAEVYGQVVAWVREQYEVVRSSEGPLQGQHLAGLQRLAHGLLFDQDLPRYLFREQELFDALGECAPEPAIRSRLIHRFDSTFDEFAFLHATFQEYFAARHLNSLTIGDAEPWIERAFASVNRLIVLEFFAGLGGPAAEQLQQRAVMWLKRQDRFGQVLLKVSRLALGGRWDRKPGATVFRTIRDELWRRIEGQSGDTFVRQAVEVYAELDPTDLCRRVRCSKKVSRWVLNCIVEAVPNDVLLQERIHESLPGEWRDFSGIEFRGIDSEAVFLAMRQVLENSSTEEDVREAVIRLGAAGDAAAAGPLIRQLANHARSALVREQIIDSLGQLGGREAVDAMIDVIVEPQGFSQEAARLAAATLRHRTGSKRALDPAGRDRLLRHLAVVLPGDATIEAVLTALDGYPIRDGAVLLFRIAAGRDYPATLRRLAIGLFATVADRALAAELVAGISDETSAEVISGLLSLAIKRELPVPLDWLMRQINACTERVLLHQFVKAFVVLWQFAPRDATAKGGFHELVAASLRSQKSCRQEMVAKALVAALELAAPDQTCITGSNWDLARETIERFARQVDLDQEGPLVLAIAIIRHNSDYFAVGDLSAALDALVGWQRESRHPNKAADRLVQSLANCLLDLSPGCLLERAKNSPAVYDALKSRAEEQGWLVFEDRILGSEGNEICATERVVGNTTEILQPVEFASILTSLSQQERNTLLGYWLMVKEGGPCRPEDSFQAIYNRLAAEQNHEHEVFMDDLGMVRDRNAEETLEALFRDEPLPKYHAWRKRLKRIADHFEGQPAILAELRRIGVCHRRSRRRR